MTLQSALIRALYIRTLRRHVAPHLGFRVVNPSNDLRPSACVSGVRKGCEVSTPLASQPTSLRRGASSLSSDHDAREVGLSGSTSASRTLSDSFHAHPLARDFT
jgi:hypothetical protein